MKKLGFALVPVALVLALAIAACGKTPSTGATSNNTSTPSNVVSMTSDNFVQHSVTVKAGQAVEFDDPAATGGVHVICLGNNMTCDNSATGPSALQNGGFTINPGEKKDVVFDKAGTYQVTCSVHPDMNVTVTVQ